MDRPPEAQLIYEAREKRGLSQLAAAKEAGISDTYWRMVESGERVLTGRRGLRTLARMADAAGVPSGAMEAAGRPDIESGLASIRLERARTLEEAETEADRMVSTSPVLTARQREKLRGLVTEAIREVRENS